MSQAEARPAKLPVTEWEPPDPPPRPKGKIFIVLVYAAALIPVTVGAFLDRGYMVWVAGVVYAILVSYLLAQRRLLLWKAVRASAEDHPRFVHIAKGLASDLGVPVPELFVWPAPGANAVVAPGALAVTGDLLESYTRTELEAVIAHCMIRLRAGGLRWALAAAPLRWGPRWAPRVDRVVDSRAAAVTCYPPALASAIEKATPARGVGAALWFVADAASHAPVEERVAELLDL